MNQALANVAHRPTVLVAEDNNLIGEFIRQILVDLGCTVLGPFEDLDGVMDAIRVGPFDGALLDLELDGASILPAATELAEHGIPFIVATGQRSSAGLPALLAQAPFLSKPFDVPEFERLVLSTFPRRQAH